MEGKRLKQKTTLCSSLCSAASLRTWTKCKRCWNTSLTTSWVCKRKTLVFWWLTRLWIPKKTKWRSANLCLSTLRSLSLLSSTQPPSLSSPQEPLLVSLLSRARVFLMQSLSLKATRYLMLFWSFKLPVATWHKSLLNSLWLLVCPLLKKTFSKYRQWRKLCVMCLKILSLRSAPETIPSIKSSAPTNFLMKLLLKSICKRESQPVRFCSTLL